MKRKLDSILVLGLGKVGTLVATLLQETGFAVTGADFYEKSGLPFETQKIDVADIEQVVNMMTGYPNRPPEVRHSGQCRPADYHRWRTVVPGRRIGRLPRYTEERLSHHRHEGAFG